jgi:hypothetical protein
MSDYAMLLQRIAELEAQVEALMNPPAPEPVRVVPRPADPPSDQAAVQGA